MGRIRVGRAVPDRAASSVKPRYRLWASPGGSGLRSLRERGRGWTPRARSGLGVSRTQRSVVDPLAHPWLRRPHPGPQRHDSNRLSHLAVAGIERGFPTGEWATLPAVAERRRAGPQGRAGDPDRQVDHQEARPRRSPTLHVSGSLRSGPMSSTAGTGRTTASARIGYTSRASSTTTTLGALGHGHP